jgi:hypothetical protein
MTTEKQIQIIVERNLPLDPTCQTKRNEQMKQRISLRLQLEELFRKIQQYEPREQIK